MCGLILLVVLITGCAQHEGNTGQMARFVVPASEAEWIRNGEPIQFEGELWYPQDAMDVLLDGEVEKLGEYQGEEFFAEKIDVRPYNRLYTKMGRNKFRIFEKNNSND